MPPTLKPTASSLDPPPDPPLFPLPPVQEDEQPPVILDPPEPPPADVIVEKIELLPSVPLTLLSGAVAAEPVPPAPTVIGIAPIETGIDVLDAKGEAVYGPEVPATCDSLYPPAPPPPAPKTEPLDPPPQPQPPATTT